MCTWITAAPAARHCFAAPTSSPRVTGSAGTAALSDSAPVGATVMSVAAWPVTTAGSGSAGLLEVMRGRMPAQPAVVQHTGHGGLAPATGQGGLAPA